MVTDSSSVSKIDYVIVIRYFFNPEGHQNPISGSEVTAILLKGWIWPIGGASSGEGLRLLVIKVNAPSLFDDFINSLVTWIILCAI